MNTSHLTQNPRDVRPMFIINESNVVLASNKEGVRYLEQHYFLRNHAKFADVVVDMPHSEYERFQLAHKFAMDQDMSVDVKVFGDDIGTEYHNSLWTEDRVFIR